MTQEEAWSKGYRPDPGGHFCDWYDKDGRPWLLMPTKEEDPDDND